MRANLKLRTSFLAGLGLLMGVSLTAAPRVMAATANTTEQSTIAEPGDYLVELAPHRSALESFSPMSMPATSKIESLGVNGWYHIQVPRQAAKTFSIEALSQAPGVLYIQPNYKLHIMESPSLLKLRAEVQRKLAQWRASSQHADDNNCPFPLPGLCNPNGGGGNNNGGGSTPVTKPPIPAPTTPVIGESDPLFSKQWGMLSIGVKDQIINNTQPVVVAVIDTGIDYTHEDLVDNLWRNPGEMGTDAQGRDKSTNQVDDDANGYVDDVIGWDFVDNDNQPYDITTPPEQLLTGEGNPGHGTHCSGNVGARGDNGKGISGADPTAKIMALRFISQKGQGTTADAVKAITYALKNGAQVMSNSWGSNGDDPSDPTGNKALHDAIQAAQDKGVLFVAAAGNGDSSGNGYDNDTSSTPSVPASYPYDIIVSVAATDSNGNLASFSNWGQKTVTLGAPGVKIFSTVVGSKYSDMVFDFGGGLSAAWDGTSMATPHVAGAAALYISTHPNATWQQVKAALIKSVTPAPALEGKTVSGGIVNVQNLLTY